MSHQILDPNQSGFRPGDSTVNQLLSLNNTQYLKRDCNPPVDVRSLYLDISKAFDRVWHDGLIYGLKVNNPPLQANSSGLSSHKSLLIALFCSSRYPYSGE